MLIADLFAPGLLLILLVAVIGAVLQAMKGRRWIRPAYLLTLSMIAACGLALWGENDLVNRQFGFVLLALVALLGLFVTGIGSLLAARQSAD